MSSSSARLTPLASLRVSRYHIPSYAGFPNTSLSPHPVVVYHRAFTPPLSSSAVSGHLRSIGVVDPQWTYPMYTQPHFHSTTHEVLVVLSGSARLQFGGPRNPDKVEMRVEEGDVMVLPAGVGHAMLKDEGGFMMLGCYPKGGEQWDHCTGGEEVERRIRGLGWFERDPIYGDEGPVLRGEAE